MTEYVYIPEIVRLAVVLGVVVSVLFYEKLQLTSGGAIVPAYLAVSLSQPLSILTTLLAGLATWVIVHRWLPKYRILYGRRKFEVELLTGLAFLVLATLVSGPLAAFSPEFVALTGVGMLLPGLIAHDMGRQGPRKTLLAIAATTAIMALIVYLLVAVFTLTGAVSQRFPLEAETRGYPIELVLYATVVSVLASLLIHRIRGLLTGGFITGAYVALVGSSWRDLVFVVACAMVTYLIVKHLLMPHLLLFGRRKLTSMILVAALVTWAAEAAVYELTKHNYEPWSGLTVVTLMVPALMANDAQRQGWEKTLWGVALSGLAVYGVMNLAMAGAMAIGWL